MATSPNLGITLIETGQSQKEVTMNEAILTLDAVARGGVIDKDLTAPPGSPAEGDVYIVANSPTGAWSGKAKNIAYYFQGGWRFIAPGEGMMVWVIDENVPYVYSGGAWGQFVEGVISAHGATTGLSILEEELTLSGADETTTIQIPNRAILLGVSSRTTQAITGATSYKVGITGELNKFGDLLNIALNSTNAGVIGPTAFYTATNVIVTANGSNFTGGKVRLAIHYITCGVPQS